MQIRRYGYNLRVKAGWYSYQRESDMNYLYFATTKGLWRYDLESMMVEVLFEYPLYIGWWDWGDYFKFHRN